MKLQTLFTLAGVTAALATASCQFASDNKGADDNSDYISHVNAHIDRRLAEFNEKEEARLPIFVPREARETFRNLSFIQSEAEISTLALDFVGPRDLALNVVFDRESRTFTRTLNGKTETYTFEPFTNGIPPAIPYDAHILYAFATDFNRIANRVELRCFERLEEGENPAIAEVEAEAANANKKGKKKETVEIKTKTVSEPLEFLIDRRWCHCYDVQLKSFCAPAVALALFVSNEEQTLSRVDVIMEDGSKESFIIDWRAQDGIVLPRVVQRLSDRTVFFRENVHVILKDRATSSESEAEAETETTTPVYTFPADTGETAEGTEDGAEESEDAEVSEDDTEDESEDEGEYATDDGSEDDFVEEEEDDFEDED